MPQAATSSIAEAAQLLEAHNETAHITMATCATCHDPLTVNVEVDDEDDQKSRDLVEELIGELADDVNSHRPDGVHNIMNDIVLDRGPNATMSGIEMFGDNEHFTTVQGDGVCVATPTGSTAYNLAAGGSLCHPENPVMLVTAISPHTLSFRPIILPDTIVLRLGVPYDARASCWASFDGKERSVFRAWPCYAV